MKQIFSKLLVVAMVLFSSITLFAQSNETVIKDLNEVFKKSLYKTEITVDKNGTVSRKDNNGNTFVFNLKDVKEIKSDNDGFQNILIVLKKGKKSKGVVEGKVVESELNVVAFKNSDDCKKAIELFNKLIE
jgi:phage pi2 protein 07